MSRPASLDGSLLARKGDAAPAIPNDSPLLEELGEPRPELSADRPDQDRSGGDVADARPGRFKRVLRWLAGHPVFGVLGLSLGVTILFVITIMALRPSSDGMGEQAMSEPEPTPAASDRIEIPIDARSMTTPSGDRAAPASGTTEATPPAADLPYAVIPPEPAPVIEPPPPPAPPVEAAPPAPPASTAPPEPPAKASTAPKAPPKKVAAKPPAPRPAKQAPALQPGRYLVQLSAVSSAGAARREIVRLERRLGRSLGDRKIVVIRAVLPGKPPVYRLRAGGYRTRAAANATCSRIRKRNLACIVVDR